MGKSLKGRELGTGISQRKDGYYVCRVTQKNGKRSQKIFKNLDDARDWLIDFDAGDGFVVDNETDIKLNAWFDTWMKDTSFARKDRTNIDYKRHYDHDIRQTLGRMKVKDVRPADVLNILNKVGKRSVGAKRMLRIILEQVFMYAIENDIIIKNPITYTVKMNCRKDNAKNKERKVFLTKQEQIDLSEMLVYNNNYMRHAIQFILQTGLRIGELMALRWEDIDFDNKVMYVRRAMTRCGNKYVLSTPKTTSGVRKVPLTKKAINILLRQKEQNSKIPVVPIESAGIVFLSKDGGLFNAGTVNQFLYRCCEKCGIERVSVHCLRHTFATRCAEAGMQPKLLQVIMGHANISTTMNIYTHISEEHLLDTFGIYENDLNVNFEGVKMANFV